MSRKEIKARFPVARIKKIMQADEDIGKVAQATPLVVAKALELFMVALINESCSQARSRNSKRVTPAHLKQAVLTTERFDFLADTVARLPDSAVPANQSNGDDMGGDQKPRQRKPRTIKAKQQQQQQQQADQQRSSISEEKDQQQYVATMPSISTAME